MEDKADKARVTSHWVTMMLTSGDVGEGKSTSVS